MTQDRFPRAGKAEGLYFSMGYSGHGAQIATHMGEIMAGLMTGQIDRIHGQTCPGRRSPDISARRGSCRSSGSTTSPSI